MHARCLDARALQTARVYIERLRDPLPGIEHRLRLVALMDDPKKRPPEDDATCNPGTAWLPAENGRIVGAARPMP